MCVWRHTEGHFHDPECGRLLRFMKGVPSEEASIAAFSGTCLVMRRRKARKTKIPKSDREQVGHPLTSHSLSWRLNTLGIGLFVVVFVVVEGWGLPFTLPRDCSRSSYNSPRCVSSVNQCTRLLCTLPFSVCTQRSKFHSKLLRSEDRSCRVRSRRWENWLWTD